MLTVECSAVKKTPDNNENTKGGSKAGVKEYKGKVPLFRSKKGQFCEVGISKKNMARLLFLNSLGQVFQKNSIPLPLNGQFWICH